MDKKKWPLSLSPSATCVRQITHMTVELQEKQKAILAGNSYVLETVQAAVSKGWAASSSPEQAARQPTRSVDSPESQSGNASVRDDADSD